MKKILFTILVLIFLSGCSFEQKTITNFQKCIDAGNPAMESYPRKCSADGQVFVEEIKNSDLPITLSDCDEEKQVCAIVMSQCLVTPCDYIYREFKNECLAEQAGAKEIKNGKCEELNIEQESIYSSITTFEECAEVGNEVLEMDPPRCKVANRLFIKGVEGWETISNNTNQNTSSNPNETVMLVNEIENITEAKLRAENYIKTLDIFTSNNAYHLEEIKTATLDCLKCWDLEYQFRLRENGDSEVTGIKNIRVKIRNGIIENTEDMDSGEELNNQNSTTQVINSEDVVSSETKEPTIPSIKRSNPENVTTFEECVNAGVTPFFDESLGLEVCWASKKIFPKPDPSSLIDSSIASSFDDCIKRGTPIAQTLPKTCVFHGKTFIQETKTEEPIEIDAVSKVRDCSLGMPVDDVEVCGLIGHNWKTYGDWCQAQNSGAVKIFEGSCDDNNIKTEESVEIDNLMEGPINNTTKTCEDQEKEIDYYLKGELTTCNSITGEEPGGSPIGCALQNDLCGGDENILFEKYCDNGEMNFEKYTCPNGCKDGACIK